MEQDINLQDMNRELMNLKKEVAMLKELMSEDIEFAKRTEEAWERFDNGEFTSTSKEEFLEELEKC